MQQENLHTFRAERWQRLETMDSAINSGECNIPAPGPKKLIMVTLSGRNISPRPFGQVLFLFFTITPSPVCAFLHACNVPQIHFYVTHKMFPIFPSFSQVSLVLFGDASHTPSQSLQSPWSSLITSLLALFPQTQGGKWHICLFLFSIFFRAVLSLLDQVRTPPELGSVRYIRG